MPSNAELKNKTTILDWMIAIGAVAAALALDRSSETPPLSVRLDQLVYRALRMAIYLLATASPATVIVWLRRSHWQPSHLWREPGFTAPAIATAPSLVFCGVQAIVRQYGGDPDLESILPFLLWIFGGVAVALGWLVQLWAGMWQPKPCRLDKLGRVLGTLWLAGLALGLIILVRR